MLRNCSLSNSTFYNTPADYIISGPEALVPPTLAPTMAPATVVISNNTVIVGNVTIPSGGLIVFSPGGLLTVTGSVEIAPNASVSIIIGANTLNGTVVQIITASSISGTFGNNVLTQFETSTCKQAQGMASYSPNEVSVLVTVSSSQCSDGLSTGAIIGIAIGAVAVGILIAVLIGLIFLKSRKKRTQELRDLNKRKSLQDAEAALQSRRKSDQPILKTFGSPSMNVGLAEGVAM